MYTNNPLFKRLLILMYFIPCSCAVMAVSQSVLKESLKTIFFHTEEKKEIFPEEALYKALISLFFFFYFGKILMKSWSFDWIARNS